MLNDSDGYRKTVKALDIKVDFHIYQIKEQCAYKNVLKDLHYTTPLEYIKCELAKLGHIVRHLINAKNYESFCNKPFRCVKCAQNHQASDCTKAKCLNKYKLTSPNIPLHPGN